MASRATLITWISISACITALIAFAIAVALGVTSVIWANDANNVFKTQCQSNGDCPVIDDRACVQYTCNLARECVESTVSGGDCSLDEQCQETLGLGYHCDTTTCQCAPIPVIVGPECLSDTDCPAISNRLCVQLFCNGNNKCQERTTPPGTCSLDTQCENSLGLGFRCQTSTCTCVPIPMAAICTTNADCPIISNRTCVEYICNSQNLCEEITSPPGQCSLTEQCNDMFGVGFICDDTCMCVNPCASTFCPSDACTIRFCNPASLECTMNQQVIGCCAFDEDCPPTNECYTSSCMNNTCIQDLAPGTCAFDADCQPNFECIGCSCVFVAGNNTCTNNTQCDDGNPFTLDWCNGINECNSIPFNPSGNENNTSFFDDQFKWIDSVDTTKKVMVNVRDSQPTNTTITVNLPDFDGYYMHREFTGVLNVTGACVGNATYRIVQVGKNVLFTINPIVLAISVANDTLAYTFASPLDSSIRSTFGTLTAVAVVGGPFSVAYVEAAIGSLDLNPNFFLKRFAPADNFVINCSHGQIIFPYSVE